MPRPREEVVEAGHQGPLMEEGEEAAGHRGRLLVQGAVVEVGAGHQSQLGGEGGVEGVQQNQMAVEEAEVEEQRGLLAAAVVVVVQTAELNWTVPEEVVGEEVGWKPPEEEEEEERAEKQAEGAAGRTLGFSGAAAEVLPVKKPPSGESWEGAEAAPRGWSRAAGAEEEPPVRDCDSAEPAERTPCALPATGEEPRISAGNRPPRSSGAAGAVEARESIRTRPAVARAAADPTCGRICLHLQWAEGHGTWDAAVVRVRGPEAPDWERPPRGFSATGAAAEGPPVGSRRCCRCSGG